MRCPGMESRNLVGMSVLRIISGFLEIGTALLFLYFKRVEIALRLNAVLGLVGPIIFLLVSGLGLITVATKVSPFKVALVALGVILIVLGSKN
ncbi:MAG TPA: YqhV family protein [Hydrogenispora sp.]|nr:YqhV family protein [Hydrogenispora sp.]